MKKKKKTSRVGFGRDDEGDCDVDNTPISSVQSPSTAAIRSSDIDQSSTSFEMPPPPPSKPPPPVPPIVFPDPSTPSLEVSDYNSNVRIVGVGAEDSTEQNFESVEEKESALHTNVNIVNENNSSCEDITRGDSSDTDVIHEENTIQDNTMSSGTLEICATSTHPSSTATNATDVIISSPCSIIQPRDEKVIHVGNPLHEQQNLHPQSDNSPVAVKTSLIVSDEFVSTSNLFCKTVDEAISSFSKKASSMCELYGTTYKDLQLARKESAHEEDMIIKIRLQLSELEKEQHDLAVLEEFDRADGLSGEIETLRTDIQSRMVRLKQLNTKSQSFEDVLSKHKVSLKHAVDEILGQLLGSKKHQEDDLLRIENDFLQRQEIEESRFKTEEERISLEVRHVEKEEISLADEEKSTQNAIDAKSGDALNLKSEFEAKLNRVQKEIEELEKALTEKRIEERRLRVDIDDVDRRISDVRSKYERQLLRIQDRKKAITSSKEACEKETQDLVREREALVKDVFQAQSFLNSIKSHCDSLGSDIDMISLVREKLCSDDMCVQFSDMICQPASSSSVKQLQDAVSQARVALSTATTEQKNMISSIESYQAELKDIKEKMLKLETEKKAFAIDKKFKEAANTARDIRSLNTREEEIIGLLDSVTKKLPSNIDHVTNLQLQLDSSILALKEAKKDDDLARYSILVARIQDLREVDRSIKSSNNVERSKHILLTCVDTELTSLLSEAATIRDELGIADSLFASDTIEDYTSNCQTSNVENHLTEGEREVEPVERKEEMLNDGIDMVERETEIDLSSTQSLNADLVAAARNLFHQIDTIQEEINAASDKENYDLAAELSEQHEAKNNELNLLLSELGITEAAARAMI